MRLPINSETTAHSVLRRFIALLLVLAVAFAAGYFLPAEEDASEETLLDPILSFFRPAKAYAETPSDVPAYVRVGLYYGNTAKTSVTLGCAGGFFLGSGGNWGFTKDVSLEGYPQITFTASGGVITGVDGNGTAVASNVASGVCVWPASGGRVTITAGSSTKTYRGGVILYAWENSLTVVNLVGIEQYLYGVINAEMYYTNPEEALKAQAVAARSFACVAQNTHKAYGFDVCSTTHCQVYRGVSGETTATTAAVDATKGQCVRYNGEVVRTYYSSNNGGWIMDIKDAWGSTSPYCLAKEDPYTPVLAWNAVLTYDEIEQRLNAIGRGVGTVTSVDVTKRTDYGYVTELTITGTERTTVFTRSQILNDFAAPLMKSQNFILIDNTKEAMLYTISEGAASEGETAEENAASDPVVSSTTGTVTVLSGDGTAAELSTSELSVQGESQTVQIPTTAEISGVKSVCFYGTGNGHSVGMSQDGAKEMAKQGFTFDEILTFYYSGTEVY